MADNAPPRRGVRAFSGGPLGIGWAPWAIGAAALAVGIFIFMRRGGGAAAAGPAQTGAPAPPPGVVPYPTGGTNAGPNPSAQSLGTSGVFGIQNPPTQGGPSSTAGPGVPAAVWQYGAPNRAKPYVWRTTSTNVPPGIAPGQIFPGSAGDPAISPGSYPGFGAYSWQWSPVPQGYTDAGFAQALSNPSATQLANFAA